MFWVWAEFPLILAAPLQEPLVLHSMLTIEPTAPLAFFCVWEPIKEADLLRLLPELASVPLPPFPMFWVWAEFPLILAAPLQEPLVLHSMLTIEPTAPLAFFCVWDPMKDADLLPRFFLFNRLVICPLAPPATFCLWLVIALMGPLFFLPSLWTFLIFPSPPFLTFCVWTSIVSVMNW